MGDSKRRKELLGEAYGKPDVTIVFIPENESLYEEVGRIPAIQEFLSPCRERAAKYFLAIAWIESFQIQIPCAVVPTLSNKILNSYTCFATPPGNDRVKQYVERQKSDMHLAVNQELKRLLEGISRQLQPQ